MVTTNWKTALPATPDATYIVVDNIALSANENTVRDFFAFCGPIESVELQKRENGTQSGLLKFSNADAAKTSLLLSNALINYEPISVAPLYPQEHPATPNNETRDVPAPPTPNRQASSSQGVANTNYEGKPALYVVHELLAAGYVVGEHIVGRASEFDNKYHVSHRTQEQARSLDNQYKFSNYLQQWDEKFNITKRAKDAYNKAQSHPVGQKVIFTVNEAYNSALQLSQNAREIAERKRASNEKLFGKIPIPPAPATTSFNNNQQQQQYDQSSASPAAYTATARAAGSSPAQQSPSSASANTPGAQSEKSGQ
ncbi:Protein vip1 [Coemansia sp. Benny D115]|nr:Protein vip1 [Coemansia sp. Benny D115]